MQIINFYPLNQLSAFRKNGIVSRKMTKQTANILLCSTIIEPQLKNLKVQLSSYHEELSCNGVNKYYRIAHLLM
jgi:hypothetical protein